MLLLLRLSSVYTRYRIRMHYGDAYHFTMVRLHSASDWNPSVYHASPVPVSHLWPPGVSALMTCACITPVGVQVHASPVPATHRWPPLSVHDASGSCSTATLCKVKSLVPQVWGVLRTGLCANFLHCFLCLMSTVLWIPLL